MAIIEKDLGIKLPIIEKFYSIQGEGYNTGKAAFFIRIAGCDIGCDWCDTKFSWNNNPEWLMSVEEIIEIASKFPAKAVVVTGGEPLNYNLNYLCNSLKNYDIKTYLETSGAYILTGSWDWICLSPKKQNPPLNEIYNKTDELKVIIQNANDFIWAEENSKKVNANCKLFLQPEWSKFGEIIDEVVEYVKANPKWNISIQAHKYMHIP
ncbi:MAG: 7-carboxy-7-deazaguanine synthase QueE [Bacteroidetes bacterium CG_4_8_14_3_um_filter_31_14]|nr:MAG: 7-carboxy-7-deazaguanine synthase QueE [Bacteroidetes bacterium CG_4_8_14_3_um_filter_31_14]